MCSTCGSIDINEVTSADLQKQEQDASDARKRQEESEALVLEGADKHTRQVVEFARKGLEEGVEPSKTARENLSAYAALKPLFFRAEALEEVREDEDVLVYTGVQVLDSIKDAYAVLTNRALYLTQFSITNKVLYRERIVDSSVTGIEVIHGTFIMKGVQTVTINRTNEKDEIRFYSEYATDIVRKTIDGWLEKKHTPEASPGADPTDSLMKVKALLDAGVISQEEFDQKKNELLGRL